MQIGMAHADGDEARIKQFELNGDLRASAALAGLRCSDEVAGKQAKCNTTMATFQNLPDASKTIANQRVLSLVFSGYENKLGMMYFSFSAASFQALKDAFVEKYPALQCVESVIKTRSGAEYGQTICKYESDLMTLSLSRRSNTVDKSDLMVTTKDYDRKLVLESAAKAQENKKDI